MLLVIIFLLLFPKEASTECTCGGVEIQMSDQMHCFEIQRNSGGSWVTADTRCAEVGGFLVHINNASLYTQLQDYVVTNYEKPLMTGATVANIDLYLVAFMCPENKFHSLLSSSFVSSSFNGTPGEDDRCTFFTNDKSGRLHYMPCDSSADVLCDRPMEKKTYCNIMMNCTTTTTSSTTTSITTTSEPTTTTSETTRTSSTTTTPRVNTTTTLTTSKTSLSSTTTVAPGNGNSTMTTTTTATTPFLGNTTTTTKKQTTITTTQASNDKCIGSGYTRVFGWCVPWWCWLIFGLLLLGILLCLLCWICHFCIEACLCSHRPEQTIMADEKPLHQWPRENIACQTDPFLLPKGETVYVPVPKTPPPEREKIVIKEIEKPPVHTHSVLHTREIVHDTPSAPVINNLTVYENAFNKHTMIVPPSVQQPEPMPPVFIPPPAIDFDRDAMSGHSLPTFSEIEESPTPQITEDIPDSVVPAVFPLSKPQKRRERPFSSLKHNRPPIGGLHPDVKLPKVGPGVIDKPSPREFPKRPASVGSEREFPKPPPDSPPLHPKQRSVTPPEFDRPIRRNTPLGAHRQPEELSRTLPRDEPNPVPPMNPLPMQSPFQVPSPRENDQNRIPRNNEKADPRASPPRNPSPLPKQSPRSITPSPKPPSTRRVSPMNDSPTKIVSSPRKFRTSSPELTSQSLMAPPRTSNTRRRSPLPEFEDSNDRTSKNPANIKPARGRLGGAVHGRPEGWKPWSNNSQLFSSNPGYLNNDG